MQLPKRFSQVFAPVLICLGVIGKIMAVVGARKKEALDGYLQVQS